MSQIKIFGTLIAVSFLLIIGIVLRYTTAADVSTSAEIQNTTPTVDTIRFATTAYSADDLTSTGILPNIGTTRTIHVNGTIHDDNGEADIASSTLNLVFHKTTATNTCTADQNDCYRITACTTDYTQGSDTEIAYNCEVPIQYFIDATDEASIYPEDNWSAYVEVEDLAEAQGTLTATIEVNSLLALNLPDAIDYGTRSLGEQSSSTTNVQTTITQRGNTKADVQVSGDTMDCDALGSLPVTAQRYALTDVGYTDGAATALSGTPTAAERNIDLRTDESNELSADLYWNIAIPASGVKGACVGSNTIAIVAQAGAAVSAYLSKLAAGDVHSLAIKSNGALYAWGYNLYGRLGLGDTTNRTTPTQVGSDTNWSKIAAGDIFSLAIKTDGTLWTWGYNGYGQLGLGDTTLRSSPTQVGTATDWSSVVAGERHSFAIKTDGTLWAWGYNGHGQLGFGNTATGPTTPTQVGSDTNWSKIAAGQYYSHAIKTDGTLFSWGINGYGQLGLGDTTLRSSPTQVGIATDWSSVVAGERHSFAIKTDGTLYAWGYNGSGRLGLGDVTNRNVPTLVGTATDWSSATAGFDHSLAIKTDGTLWVWGYNANGRLGLGNTTAGPTSPVKVGTATDWSVVEGGGSHSLAIKTDGTILSWGYNATGQLGLNDTTQRTVPTSIPTLTLAILPTRERRNGIA